MRGTVSSIQHLVPLDLQQFYHYPNTSGDWMYNDRLSATDPAKLFPLLHIHQLTKIIILVYSTCLRTKE